jgi:hypothetical protein
MDHGPLRVGEHNTFFLRGVYETWPEFVDIRTGTGAGGLISG